MNPNVFEVIMLICFGIAWPFSICEMLKTKKSQGKSIHFSIAIFMGYIAGIFFQYFSARNYVLFLYMLNAFMVAFDVALTIKYRRN